MQKTILLLIATLLIVCLSVAFVACDDGDDNDNGNNINDVTNDDDTNYDIPDIIDVDILRQTLTGMLGYSYAHKDEYKILNGEFGFRADGFDWDFCEGAIMGFALEMSESAQQKGIDFILYHFIDEESASNAYSAYLNGSQFDGERFNGKTVTQYGKSLVFESRSNLYDDIKNSTIPEGAYPEAQLKFFETALKSELTSNTKEILARCFVDEYDDAIEYGLVSYPKIGNRNKEYRCYSKIVKMNPLVDLDLNECTTDSYMKKNGDFWYVYYQPAIGFTFYKTEDKTRYRAGTYYYDENPTEITVPAVHNDIPVVGVSIGKFDLPESLTTITIPKSIQRIETFGDFHNISIIYQGTKAEWARVSVFPYYKNIEVIHCTDGDIYITENDRN